jgi:hypothetical protein
LINYPNAHIEIIDGGINRILAKITIILAGKVVYIYG